MGAAAIPLFATKDIDHVIGYGWSAAAGKDLATGIGYDLGKSVTPGSQVWVSLIPVCTVNKSSLIYLFVFLSSTLNLKTERLSFLALKNLFDGSCDRFSGTTLIFFEMRGNL